MSDETQEKSVVERYEQLVDVIRTLTSAVTGLQFALGEQQQEIDELINDYFPTNADMKTQLSDTQAVLDAMILQAKDVVLELYDADGAKSTPDGVFTVRTSNKLSYDDQEVMDFGIEQPQLAIVRYALDTAKINEIVRKGNIELPDGLITSIQVKVVAFNIKKLWGE